VSRVTRRAAAAAVLAVATLGSGLALLWLMAPAVARLYAWACREMEAIEDGMGLAATAPHLHTRPVKGCAECTEVTAEAGRDPVLWSRVRLEREQGRRS
jgi:hypothetical protein